MRKSWRCGTKHAVITPITVVHTRLVWWTHINVENSLCGVNDLFSSTKHICFGVITTDGCKNTQRSCTGTVDVSSHRGTYVLSGSWCEGTNITGLHIRRVIDFSQLFTPTEWVQNIFLHGGSWYRFFIWSYPNHALSSKKMVWSKKKTVGVHTTLSAHSCFGTSTYLKNVNLCQFYQKGWNDIPKPCDSKWPFVTHNQTHICMTVST